MKDDTVYEERIVAFLDILGFKNIIDKTANSVEESSKVLEILKSFEKIKESNNECEKEFFGREVSFFSDSIVISYPLTTEGGLYHIMMDLIHIQLESFFSNILFRGGIAIGKLYHKGNIVFGPGMIEAYNLECKIAKDPRIVINFDTIETGIVKTCPVGSTIKNETGNIEQLILSDPEVKELYYLDPLSQYAQLDHQLDYENMLAKLKKYITAEEVKQTKRYDNCQNLTEKESINKVISKIKWFKDYFNETISEYDLVDYKV